MKVIYVGELDRTPDSPDHKGIRQGAEWMGWDFKIVDPILLHHGDVIEECNKFGADLIIHGNTDSLNHEIIPHIRAGKQVFFMGDVQPSKDHYQNWETWKRNAKGISAIFISNRTQIPLWEKEFGVPTFFWPHGCYVEPELPPYKPEFDKDVLFIGSMMDNGIHNVRTELIKAIGKEIPIHYINRDDVNGRNEIWRQMPDLYRSTKITLDISHFWDLDGYASGRYWYTGGFGACSVTKRFPECEEFYEEGEKHYFDTLEQAVGIIRYLLTHPEEIEATRIKAYERNKKDHNYKVRFEQMLLCLTTLPSKN